MSNISKIYFVGSGSVIGGYTALEFESITVTINKHGHNIKDDHFYTLVSNNKSGWVNESKIYLGLLICVFL